MNALQRDLKKLVPLVESLGKADVEADPYRQQFHLQPPVGWLNDPNGLCVYGGQYHAFFQYGPFDVTGGVKHWGHAVSKDLLHWEPLPVMLYPDEPFDCHGVYSGSALIEGTEMYLYYTGNVKHPGDFDYIKQGRGHNVCLAVSHDGKTVASKQCLLYNKDYPAGLTCHVRDPKVFVYEGKYYMVLGARTLEDKGEVLVLESTDKLHWNHINTLTTPEPFGYMWECPDLFCLDGQWYLAVSPQGIQCQNIYGCGYFAVYGDWRAHCTLGEFHEMDAGFDYYAPQSFVDENGRRIQIGWMGMPDADYGNAPTVAHGWQHCFTVPRLLTKGENGTLLQTPVPELDARRSAAALTLRNGEEASLSPCFDLTAAPAGDFALTVAHGVELVYTEQDSTCVLQFTDPAQASGRTQRRTKLSAPCRSVRVVGDRSSLEIFLNDGAAVFSTRYYPAAGDVAVKISGTDALVYSL
ncbi:glycoside hydrolase family 32 protein [Faecalibacterium prausnitzii]|uniref:glycoside hydrolase family 32 protein n=1 Tax=Faecalibacterium prausnitzii TaxID=853 RepID=UPI002908A838|nr:glycoside hydrolase family 32 protein [Faecalibacterium prausnitzii]